MRESAQDIPTMIRQRFGRIAIAPGEEKKFPVGPGSAKALGYDPREIDQLPGEVTESFAGVGNPLSLAELVPGQTVLDLGCGAGLDSMLAARRILPTGRVIGVDTTDAMIEKARRSARTVGVANTEFLRGDIESLPLDADTIDMAISNGVFNLCPDKPKALAETCRVLKPGGRLLMADVLLEEHVTPEEVTRLGTWSD